MTDTPSTSPVPSELTGNAVTGTRFLGSTNCKPLVIKIDGTETIRLLAGHGSVANCGGNATPGVQVEGALTALSRPKENGTDLSDEYVKLNGSNAPGSGVPIGITGDAAGFTGSPAFDGSHMSATNLISTSIVGLKVPVQHEFRRF